MSVKEHIRNLLDQIIELDKQKEQKQKEIKSIRWKCIHDFEKIYSGYEEDIFICKICGYEDSVRRSM